MSFTTTTFVRCQKAERYIQQLAKHWSHKMAATYDLKSKSGFFPFSEETKAEMSADEKGIAISLVTADQTANERMQGVIQRHIDRFAFREVPLTYNWEIL